MRILEHEGDPTKTIRYLRQFTEKYLRTLLVEARAVHYEAYVAQDYKTVRAVRARMRAIVRELFRRDLKVSDVYQNPRSELPVSPTPN